jgi:hypothetical protein
MFNFIAQMLSGDTGQASTQRVCLLLIVVAMVAWTSSIVIKSAAIPNIPDTWVWLIGVFVAGVSGGKAIDAYKTVKTTPAGEVTQ